MHAEDRPLLATADANQVSADETLDSQETRAVNRRSFLKGAGTLGAAIAAGGILSADLFAQMSSAPISKGDAALLRFACAAEIIETDLWLQYAELAGTQDKELPGLTGGNPLFTLAVGQLDEDMDQYIHDNTEDEKTHEKFINAYLIAKGADPVNLNRFRTLPSSRATGARQIGRLTNLMQLAVDTTWYTRYRARHKNPDLGDTFRQAIPTLVVGEHTAIPRTDDDVQPDGSKPNGISDFTQAIANTAGFHFATIEQGGSSMYPSLAQRANNVEVLRILLSIGGTEIMHFQTWQDKAGNAPPLSGIVDPVTGVKVTFPDLNAPPLGGENFQTNLIMPEPTTFLSASFPVCSIIRPTKTEGAAAAALKGFVDSGLFKGQSPDFFDFMNELATEADAARRHS